MENISIPHHIAIIPDGNRRWAKSNNLPTFEGHRRGAQTAIQIARKTREMGISTLTFWAFSTENWKRAQDEVNGIIKLGGLFIEQHLKEAMKDNVRITHLGRKDRMPEQLRKKIEEAEEKTAENTKHYLNLAFDYGGHDEIVRAIKKLTHEELENLDEETFSQNLDTGNLPYPNPDIVIRTSGEKRTSGFMPWQTAYSEYLYLEKFFPDMDGQDIENAVEEFANRSRRFGK